MKNKILIELEVPLIEKKYGLWEENKIYNETKKKLLYKLRMKLIEQFIKPYDISQETEETLKQKIKSTTEAIKNNAN